MKLEERTHWVIADIEAIRGVFDTVLQNPPFGVQRKGADQKFIRKSLELGTKIYSLHKANFTTKRKPKHQGKYKLKKMTGRFKTTLPSLFISGFIERHGGQIKAVYPLSMTIPYMFEFHRRPKHKVPVHLYVIEREGTQQKENPVSSDPKE